MQRFNKTSEQKVRIKELQEEIKNLKEDIRILKINEVDKQWEIIEIKAKIEVLHKNMQNHLRTIRKKVMKM